MRYSVLLFLGIAAAAPAPVSFPAPATLETRATCPAGAFQGALCRATAPQGTVCCFGDFVSLLVINA